MAETVAVLDNGATTRKMSKPELLDYLKAESARAKAKIENDIPAEAGGLRARLDACERLHSQVSPLTDKNIDEAAENGSWKGEPFPIKAEERLSALANELMIG